MSLAWNPARLDRLKSLWNQGKTAKEIGQDLEVSRNAVLAKAARLGLKRSAAGETLEARFDKVIRVIAEAPLNAPADSRRAAKQYGLPVAQFDRMWSDLCARYGEQTRGGDKLVRPLA